MVTFLYCRVRLFITARDLYIEEAGGKKQRLKEVEIRDLNPYGNEKASSHP